MSYTSIDAIPLKVTQDNYNVTLTVPYESKILSVGVYAGMPHVWIALADSFDLYERLHVCVHSSGPLHITSEWGYVGHYDLGAFTSHVFYRRGDGPWHGTQ